MTFPIKDGVQSYKPNFELPIEGQAVQPMADAQAAAGTNSKQVPHWTLQEHKLELLGFSVILSNTGMRLQQKDCATDVLLSIMIE